MNRTQIAIRQTLTLITFVVLVVLIVPVSTYASKAASSMLFHKNYLDLEHYEASWRHNLNDVTEVDDDDARCRNWLFAAHKAVLRADVQRFEVLLKAVTPDPNNVCSPVARQIPFMIHLITASGFNSDLGQTLGQWLDFNAAHGLRSGNEHQEERQVFALDLAFLNGDTQKLQKTVNENQNSLRVTAYAAWLLSRLDQQPKSRRAAIDLHQQLRLGLSEKARFADLIVRQFSDAELGGTAAHREYVKIENYITGLRAEVDPVSYPLIYIQALDSWAKLLQLAAEKMPQSAHSYSAERARVLEVKAQLRQNVLVNPSHKKPRN